MGRERKNYQDAESTFKRLMGVSPECFTKMEDILQKEYARLHKKGGSPLKLSIKDKLTITLKYYREYRTMESIGADYGVSKSTACQTIQWVESALGKDKTFKLPGKKALAGTPQEIQCVIVDVTESPIQRPKKTKGRIIQGKRSVIPKDTGDNQPEEPADTGHTASEGQGARFQTVQGQHRKGGRAVDTDRGVSWLSGGNGVAAQQPDTQEIKQETQTEREGKSV